MIVRPVSDQSFGVHFAYTTLARSSACSIGRLARSGRVPGLRDSVAVACGWPTQIAKSRIYDRRGRTPSQWTNLWAITV